MVLVIILTISWLHVGLIICFSFWSIRLRHQLHQLLSLRGKWLMGSPLRSLVICLISVRRGLVTQIIYLGQRMPWYVFGLVLVSACYLPIYQTFQSENKTHEYIYYTIFPSLFNVGWAALQISHMSLVPALTCSRKRRVIDAYMEG